MSKSKQTVISTEVTMFKREIKKLEAKGWNTIPGSIIGEMEHVSMGSSLGSIRSEGKGFFACVMEKDK